MPSEDVEEIRKKRKRIRKRTNLVDELGDFLKSLHHIHQSLDFVSFVMVNGTLSADCLLGCLAVRVDLLLWMLVTTSGPRR